jgi:hypothetical protein
MLQIVGGDCASTRSGRDDIAHWRLRRTARNTEGGSIAHPGWVSGWSSERKIDKEANLSLEQMNGHRGGVDDVGYALVTWVDGPMWRSERPLCRTSPSIDVGIRA